MANKEHELNSRRRGPERRSIEPAELDSFSRQHEGWIVSITQQTADGRTAIQARDLPLQGVSPIAHGSKDIGIAVGNANHHLTHDVRDATELSLELTDSGAERALVINARDGSTTRVEFRSPMRPEEVDGLPHTPTAE
jgi:hypothetical protein